MKGGVLKFEGRIAVAAEGGKATVADGKIAVKGADAATLYVAIATNFPSRARSMRRKSMAPRGGSIITIPTSGGMSRRRAVLRAECGRAAAEATDILGRDKAYAERLRRIAADVEPHHIGKWGQLQEWTRDLDSPKDRHRHTSHLYALYPSFQITPETPELFNAAKVSLEARGDESTGWSLAWRMNLETGGHSLSFAKIFAPFHMGTLSIFARYRSHFRGDTPHFSAGDTHFCVTKKSRKNHFHITQLFLEIAILFVCAIQPVLKRVNARKERYYGKNKKNKIRGRGSLSCHVPHNRQAVSAQEQ